MPSLTIRDSLTVTAIAVGTVQTCKETHGAIKRTKEVLRREDSSAKDYADASLRIISAAASAAATSYSIQGAVLEKALTAQNVSEATRDAYKLTNIANMNAQSIRIIATINRLPLNRRDREVNNVLQGIGHGIAQTLVSQQNLSRGPNMVAPIGSEILVGTGIAISAAVTAHQVFNWWSTWSNRREEPFVLEPREPFVVEEPEDDGASQISDSEASEPGSVQDEVEFEDREAPADLPNEIPEQFHNDPTFSQFICPITQLPIRFPVTLRSGNGHDFHFERAAIRHWVQTCINRRNPITNPASREEIDRENLVENLDIRDIIENRLRELLGQPQQPAPIRLQTVALDRLWNAVLRNSDPHNAARIFTEAQVAAPNYMRDIHREVYRLCQDQGLVRGNNPHFGRDAFQGRESASAHIDAQLRFKALVNVEIEHLKSSFQANDLPSALESIERLERYNPAYIRKLHNTLYHVCQEKRIPDRHDRQFGRKALRGVEGFAIDSAVKIEAMNRCGTIYHLQSLEQ